MESDVTIHRPIPNYIFTPKKVRFKNDENAQMPEYWIIHVFAVAVLSQAYFHGWSTRFGVGYWKRKQFEH